jgi:hypothetical protein
MNADNKGGKDALQKILSEYYFSASDCRIDFIEI